jgi:predicted phage terminase large subunit-like protein
MTTLKPQPGPQEAFLASQADVVIYGGAAGGGKSWALLLEPLRHKDVPGFTCVLFRRTTTQVRNPGGLWDESAKVYPLVGGQPVQHALEWRWPSGAKVKMAHLEHESSVYDWQGAQLSLIEFDELCHFSRAAFFYMLSRNRSMCGVKPYVRATCNPDAESWVAEFIAWWLGADGQPIAERSGAVRWFIRVNDKLIWADTAEELKATYAEAQPKSVTFIAARLADNKALMEADPGYLANLMALDFVERERLLGGNWKIRPAAGLYFRRSWVEVLDAAPHGLDMVRYWDLAATEKTSANDPDFTVGVKLGRDPRTGRFYLLHGASLRSSPLKVEQAIVNTATADGPLVRVGLPQDPGQAGKAQAEYLVRRLAGFTASTRPERGGKTGRFGPFSAQCEAGNVAFVRGPWNEEFFTALEGFPDAVHDDHADACSGALGMFTDSATGLIDHYRRMAAEHQADTAEGQAQ